MIQVEGRKTKVEFESVETVFCLHPNGCRCCERKVEVKACFMEDARNFRSSYYEKVGCRSVEEKKSLEILLKENPVNLPKLKQFLKLFAVPSIHRTLLYEIVLSVYPIYMDSKEW